MQREYKMQEIIKAIEESAIKIRDLIQTGDTGKSEHENSTGDTQLKLDIASDKIIEDIFKNIINWLEKNQINLSTSTLNSDIDVFLKMYSNYDNEEINLSLLSDLNI